MTAVRDWLLAGCVIVAALGAYRSANSILRGDLKEGLTPGWTDIAIAHPEMFAIVVVVGVLLFPPLRLILENV